MAIGIGMENDGNAEIEYENELMMMRMMTTNDEDRW